MVSGNGPSRWFDPTKKFVKLLQFPIVDGSVPVKLLEVNCRNLLVR